MSSVAFAVPFPVTLVELLSEVSAIWRLNGGEERGKSLCSTSAYYYCTLGSVIWLGIARVSRYFLELKARESNFLTKLLGVGYS